MGASGGFPIDLILFGMIAAFLVLRLRGILGRRTGYERPPGQQAPQREGPAPPERMPGAPQTPPAPAISRTLPDPLSELGQTLVRMKEVDRAFEPGAFLDGAEKAFALIVHAFAAGDRATLRPLLGDDTCHAFDLAIGEREKAGHTQVTDIRGIHGLSIEAAELKRTIASVMVRIVSDQVNMTRTQAGQYVAGTDAVTEITDLWTFERDLAQPNPAWHLVAARSA